MKAICIEVDGGQDVPANTVKQQYLEESRTHTTCPRKGEASYYHVKVNGEVILDGAWYYGGAKEAAREIKDHIAFGKGVDVKA